MDSTTDDTDLSSCERSDKPKMYKCPIDNCKASFKKQSKLLHHIRVHTGERPFVCNENGCKKSYTNSSHLRRHKASVHATKPKATKPKVKCTHDGCELDFYSTTNLKRHIARKHDENRKYRFKCQICDEGFCKKTLLQKHIYVHTGVKSFECTKCPLKFISSTDLKKHMRTHTTYTCECGEKFERYLEMIRHNKEKHKTRSKCDECDKTFTTKHSLRQHNKMIHIPVKQMEIYSCPRDGCERAYMYKKNLKAHIRQFHDKLPSKTKRIPCPIEGCDITLSRMQCLRTHLEYHKKPDKTKMQRKQRKDAGIPNKSIKSSLAGINLTRKANQKLLSNKKIDIDTLLNRKSRSAENETDSESDNSAVEKKLLAEWDESESGNESDLSDDTVLLANSDDEADLADPKSNDKAESANPESDVDEGDLADSEPDFTVTKMCDLKNEKKDSKELDLDVLQIVLF